MQERIESVRRTIDSIRKSGTLPHWRMVYADTLLERAEDYIAIDRVPEAGMVLDKLASGYGDVALAAIGIVLKAERLPQQIGIGLCQSMVPLVGARMPISRLLLIQIRGITSF